MSPCVDDTLEIRLSSSSVYGKSSESPYPGWNRKFIPVKLLYDYPLFWVVQVQPHDGLFGTTGIYNVTIDKRDLHSNLFTWRFANLN